MSMIYVIHKQEQYFKLEKVFYLFQYVVITSLTSYIGICTWYLQHQIRSHSLI